MEITTTPAYHDHKQTRQNHTVCHSTTQIM